MFSPAGDLQILPIQTNSTLKGVLGMMSECCSLTFMLARVLLILTFCICSYADAEQPHVILVQLNSVEEEGGIDKAFGDRWQRRHGNCIASPGHSAAQTALLFGTPSLQQGVVSDLDWRRKPVPAPTLVNILKKAGYQTQFHGAWGLGSTAPFDPQSRGFDQAVYFENGDRDTLADHWNTSTITPKWHLENKDTGKPVFAVIAEGRHLSRQLIMQQLKAWLQKTKNPTVVMILERGVVDKDGIFNPAKWYCFSTQNIKKPLHIETDWQMNYALLDLLGVNVKKESEFLFFHQANWPLGESPEKYRHRGSMVHGMGHCLVDGLMLFPADSLTSDLVEHMDIAKHQKEHRILLTAHGRWWRLAGKALHDQRAFDVGGKEVVKLTAQDWRGSKVISTEGKSPSSVPMVYRADLLAILEGLKNNEEYKATFPAYSGSWAVNMKRPGRYKITASLLPRDTQSPEQKALMKLQGGTAHIRLGGNVVQLRLIKGATSISIQTDADAGIHDLECWFTGQLALTRELGAFFVEIERVGDKKFDLKAEPKE